MATYQALPVGDFKPMGVLAGIYAGQNAANQEQQNEIANLAELFDQRQKDLTYRTGEFNLGETQAMAGDVRSEAALRGAQARQLATPDALDNYRLGKIGEWQTSSAKGKSNVATVDSDILLKQAQNVQATGAAKQSEKIRVLGDLAQVVKNQGIDYALQYVDNTYQNPEQRDALRQAVLLGEVGIKGMIRDYTESDPAYISKMAEQRLKNEGGLDVAKENSKGSIASATRAANAAIYNGGKLALAQAKDAATVALQSSKQYFDEVTASIEQWKGDKASPDYKQLLAQQKVARTRAENAVNLLVRLAKKLEEPLPLQQDGSETPKTSNQVLDYSKLP